MRSPSMKDKLLNGLNLILVANIFLVLFGFFWFVAAVIGQAANLPLGLDIWYQLWQPLFTPAIGLLMGGAILSGVISQIKKRLPSQPN
jgi:hypothetical protein